MLKMQTTNDRGLPDFGWLESRPTYFFSLSENTCTPAAGADANVQTA